MAMEFVHNVTGVRVAADRLVDPTQSLPASVKRAVTEQGGERFYVIGPYGQEIGVSIGDWVIIHPHGSGSWVVKPEVFEKDYEKVDG